MSSPTLLSLLLRHRLFTWRAAMLGLINENGSAPRPSYKYVLPRPSDFRILDSITSYEFLGEVIRAMERFSRSSPVFLTTIILSLSSFYCSNSNSFIVIVVAVLGFTTLLTSQVISVAFYSEREKSYQFCSEALISA